MGHHSVLSFPQEHTPEPNPQFIIMNPMFVTLALLGLAVVDATIVIGTVATTATATTLSASTVATLGILGGVAILKGLVLGQVIKRGKRSAESENDAAFAVLTNSEPAQCYRRLICDMAAGAIPDEGKILSLFNTEVSPASAKVGKMVRKAGLCELRYSCPLTTQEIAKLF